MKGKYWLSYNYLSLPPGMADAPPSPLLTCIPQKARNYFKIREKKGLFPGSFVSP